MRRLPPTGRCSHDAGRSRTPRPPAHTPGGSAATSDTQAGRGPGSPSDPGWPHAEAAQPPGSAAPTTGAALTATLEPRFLRSRAREGPAAPQSIHAPCCLLGPLAQLPRPHCEGAAVRLPVPAPVAATTVRLLPAPADERLLSRIARDAHPGRRSLHMQRGRRPLARGRWRVRGWAYRIPAGERGAGGPARGGAGLLQVIRRSRRGRDPAAASAGRGPSRWGGRGLRQLEEGSRAPRPRRGRRIGGSRRVCKMVIPRGKQSSSKKKTRSQFLL